MSVWVSQGDEIPARRYVHSGHLPKRTDPISAGADVAVVPGHLSRGVWVRLSLYDVGDPRVVFDRRGATKLRDALTTILEEDGR